MIASNWIFLALSTRPLVFNKMTIYARDGQGPRLSYPNAQYNVLHEN